MSVVLYVEDHPPAQLLMQAIVGEMTAHQLQVASSGEEARALAEKLAPDLYIVDMDLPDGDGISLARTLTAIHNAPVLLVSAYAEAIKESAIRAVIYAYLAKPLDPGDVARTIERALA
jgi:CheY-like chemotaxis protein